MKKLLSLLALFVLVAVPASAGGIGIAYGTWDTDTADDDQGAAVKLEIDLGTHLDFEVRASFFDSFRQADGSALFEIEATPLDLGVNYDFSPTAVANFYAAGGGTLLLISPNDQDTGSGAPSRPRSQEEFGWYGGFGVEFAVGPSLAVFAEALYRDASGEVRGRNLGSAPEREFEVDFGGTSAYVGLMFTW